VDGRGVEGNICHQGVNIIKHCIDRKESVVYIRSGEQKARKRKEKSDLAKRMLKKGGSSSYCEAFPWLLTGMLTSTQKPREHLDARVRPDVRGRKLLGGRRARSLRREDARSYCPLQ